jgi:5-methylcytosine-specific restriction enzyme subunit McrC
MKPLTLFEFDKVIEEKVGAVGITVPSRVFTWLEAQCLRSEGNPSRWLKLAKQGNQRAIQVTSYVGVIRAPCGFQIEILPKTGKHTSPDEARALLIEMLKCMAGFRHIKTDNADLLVQRIPLLEVFIQQFLLAVSSLIKRGLRSDYVVRQDNLFALRGRLLVARQITQNLLRRERFFTEHDEFSQDRAENRLIHTALHHVLSLCQSQENQRVARELNFVFAEVPLSVNITLDIHRIRLDRGMGYYQSALDWAKLILLGLSPNSGVGKHHAPSLLFPMEGVFEAYVKKHLASQLRSDFVLKAQASSQHLVAHDEQQWFRMKPDLLVKQGQITHLVLDTKWKLLDTAKKNGREKYQLNQADFYQLYAYGHHYLDGCGEIVLIYPKTDAFTGPLPVFDFPKSSGLRLWVLPFCLQDRCLKLPVSARLLSIFVGENCHVPQVENFNSLPS